MAAALGVGLVSRARRVPGRDDRHYGHAEVYHGRIEGDRLVFESLEGVAPRLRLTWDASDPGVIFWRNEMSLDEGSSWFLIEEYAMVPA